MYVVMVYDVNTKRVAKILKIGRIYLNWVQNSVLEGELTKAQFEKLKTKIAKAIDDQEDSVLFYIMENQKLLSKEKLGVEKNIISNII